MKISIIIPTRERAFYLGASIQTVLDIQDDDIELIVADNASTDATAEVVSGFDDPRLTYLPSDQRVSMRENFNRSILASSGDYVIVFGDDDAILPGQFPHLRRLMEQHHPDAISWFKATYGWPVEGFGNKTGGIRFYRQDCFGSPVFYDPREDLGKLMQCDLQHLHPAPNIYHGCVSRDFLDRHKPSDGVFFDSTIPDVNFQYRCNYVGGSFIDIRHPFTINGYGPVSTGGAHTAPAQGSAGDKIGKSFVAENKADPYDDIIDHALTIPLVFFSTLETLRQRSGLAEPQPDYVEWYRYALSAKRQKPADADRIDGILAAYADQTRTQEALAAARQNPLHSQKTFADRWTRWVSQARSFRLSAALDGENTVHSAARVMDRVLGEGFRDILDGTDTKNGAWAKAKRRSKNFQREL